MSRFLDPEEITRQLGDLPGWAYAGGELRATYDAPSFPAAIRLVEDVAAQAEQMDHHPDIDIRWRSTRWILSTHSEHGVTQLDIELAHRIAEAARVVGAVVAAAVVDAAAAVDEPTA